MQNKILSRSRRLFWAAALIGSLFSTSVSASGEPGNSPPWDHGSFASTGPELIAAANAVPTPEDAGVVVLMDEATFSFDAEGRCLTRYRLAYRVLTQAGMESWAGVAAAWSPWYEERPSLRARVVTPDGVEHRLLQETIAEGPMADESSNVFSDRRVVRAPLPALAVGAVVEKEIVLREKSPAFAAGNINRFYFGQGVPTLKTRLVLESPSNLPLRYVVRLLPGVTGVASEEPGRTRLTFEAGAMEPLKTLEPGLPGDVPHWPNVAFSTGRSWEAVSKSYAEIVDGRINGSDLSTLVRETVGDSTDRRQIAAKLLERLRKQIRYTGIEFGEASIVPHTPEETLIRKYGDCKDQAALLVKMLRTAGVPANLALLRSGTGEDLEPDLPGMGNFNHAIVYLPGTPPLWIDPTNKFRLAGELPLPDRGRRALIAGGATTSLTLTPEAASEENREVEQREFILSELGNSRVTETTRVYGSIASSFRGDYRQTSAKKLRQQLEGYAKSAYLAERLTRMNTSDPNDLGQPFRITLEMEDAKRGVTDDNEAVVAIVHTALTDRLPKELTGDDATVRKNDYLLPEPYVYEMQYRMVPPPGFRARQLPDSGTTWLGPMKLSKQFRLEDDGVVTALLRFDTGKNRLTPAEFEAAKKGVRAFQDENPIFIHFGMTAQSLLAAGKVQEALKEFRRLCSLHPKEALHHSQLANALLELGLVDASIREAERAVALEPESAIAHRTLAWILQHDQFGRLRRKGFDRKRSLEEYRKAKALAPRDFRSRGDLAILLEHDAEGKRYGRSAEVEEAIKEYRDLREVLKRTELDENLLLCLYWTERWQELRELVQALPSAESRIPYLLLAIAGEQGATAAIKEAQRRITNPEKLRTTLQTVASSLVMVRRYQEAAQLLEEAAKGAANNAVSLSARSKLLNTVQRYEKSPLSFSEAVPTNAFNRMMLSLFTPNPPYSLLSQFASYIREEAEDEKSAVDLGKTLDLLHNKVGEATEGVNGEVVVDLTLSSFQFHVEGSDAAGYRIDAVASAVAGSKTVRFYLTKEKELYRVVAAESDPTAIGLEALRRVEAGDLQGAKTWLDWAREATAPAERDEDPLSQNPFHLVWPQSSAADPERMRLAAAVLVSNMNSKQRPVLPLLLQGREYPGAESRLAVDIALGRAYLVEKRYPELLAHCDKLAVGYPLSRQLFVTRVAALGSQERWDDIKALSEERLRKLPKDKAALRALAACAEKVGNFELAARWYQEVLDDGNASAVDYNNLAWLGLFSKSVPAQALTYAERSVAMTDKRNPGFLHTLSALYAAAGKPAEARETLLKALEVDDPKDIGSHYWYVLGRIAEQYGEMETAKEAYRKVTETDEVSAISTYALARERL